MASYSRTTLQRLAEAKLSDARFLYEHKRFSNAYYLGGYAVELGLKATVSLQFAGDTLPDKRLVNETYTHNLRELIRLAGLQSRMKIDQDANATFAANWGIVAAWDEAARYTSIDPFKAGEFMSALTDSVDGVFAWLKRHW